MFFSLLVSISLSLSLYYLEFNIPQFNQSTMAKTFTKDDVASHNKADGLWIIVDEDVYDLTKFQDEHPGKLFLLSSSIHYFR